MLRQVGSVVLVIGLVTLAPRAHAGPGAVGRAWNTVKTHVRPDAEMRDMYRKVDGMTAMPKAMRREMKRMIRSSRIRQLNAGRRGAFLRYEPGGRILAQGTNGIMVIDPERHSFRLGVTERHAGREGLTITQFEPLVDGRLLRTTSGIHGEQRHTVMDPTGTRELLLVHARPTKGESH